MRDDRFTTRRDGDLQHQIVARISQLRPPKKENILLESHTAEVINDVVDISSPEGRRFKMSHQSILVFKNEWHRDRDLEVPTSDQRQNLERGPAPRANCGDEDVRVEYHPHELYGITSDTTLQQIMLGQLAERRERVGVLNPRVLHGVITEGSLCDDELTKLYFAGLLTSSLSPDGTDDRSLRYMNIVRQLSRSEIAIHHLAYKTLRLAFRATKFSVDVAHHRELLDTSVSRNVAGRIAHTPEIAAAADILLGLVTADLLERATIKAHKPEDSAGTEVHGSTARGDLSMEHAVLFRPSVLGVRLFLWVHGSRIHLLPNSSRLI